MDSLIESPMGLAVDTAHQTGSSSEAVHERTRIGMMLTGAEEASMPGDSLQMRQCNVIKAASVKEVARAPGDLAPVIITSEHVYFGLLCAVM